MGKTHEPYAPEFRQQMVELLQAGRSPEELMRLRRQVRQLQMERDTLAKATAWFASHNGSC